MSDQDVSAGHDTPLSTHRECLALEVDRGITADRVLNVLTHLFLVRRVPMLICSDNGPEFIGKATYA